MVGGAGAAVAGIAAFVVPTARPGPARAARQREAGADTLRAARAELEAMRASLELSEREGTAPDFAALARASRSGALGNLQAATAELDRVVGAGRLEAWEDAAWESVEVDGGVAGSGDTALPFGLGPNAFTCAVFSCYNSPDTPVSTSLLLDVKMLQKGVELGARGDSRVSATGLLGNVGDLVEKLDAYAAALAAARAPAPPE